MRAKPFIVAILLLGLSISCAAQLFPFVSYTENQGLPHNNIFSIIQDDKGFMWFGTENGLSRFDGQRFVNYGEEEGLKGLVITHMRNLPDQTLLVGDKYSAHVTFIKEGVINTQRLRGYSGKPLVVWGDTMICHKTHKYLSLQFLDKSTGTLVERDLKYEFFIINLFQLSTGDVLAGGNKGVYKMDRTNFTLVPLHPELREIKANCFIEDKLGNVWVGSDAAIYCIRTDGTIKKFTSTDLQKANSLVEHMAMDHKGRLWLSATSVGLMLLEDGVIRSIGSKLGLSNRGVFCIYEDREFNIWVATQGQGVFCVKNSPFLGYSMKQGLPHNQINSIASNEDGVTAIGTYDGLAIIEDASVQQVPLQGEKKGTLYVYQVGFDNQDNILVANNMLPIGRHIRYENGRFPLLLIARTSFIPYRNQEIISSSWFEHVRIEKWFKHKASTEVIHSAELFGRGKRYKVNTLYEDSKGQVWVGTSRGLCCLRNKADNTCILPKGLGSNELTQLSSKINAIVEDADHTLWVATTRGLLSHTNGKWTLFTKDNGISNNNCTSVACDQKGRLWIGTSSGLNVWDGHFFRSFNQQDGLISDGVQALHFNKVKGQLFVGTVNGLSVMDLNQPLPDNQVPHTYITSIASGDSLFNSFSDLKLKYHQNSVSIAFIGLNYRSPGNVVYQYRLNEDDEDSWRTTIHNEVELVGLDYEEHRFEVRARTGNSSWSQPATIVFDIQPPFWRSDAFNITMILLLAGLTSGVISFRIRSIKKKEREKRKVLQRMAQLEQQALSALMNPHFIFNALNSIQHYLNVYSEEEANEYLAKFARLIRLNMEVSQKGFVPLSEEMERLDLYLALEQLRFNPKLKHEVKISSEIDTDELVIPSMVIQPFVENAIWHGLLPADYPGFLSINIQLQEHELIIHIEDNGIGYEASQQSKPSNHISRGMSITKERLQHLYHPYGKEARIILEELEQGTRVIISLPLLPEEATAIVY